MIRNTNREFLLPRHVRHKPQVTPSRNTTVHPGIVGRVRLPGSIEETDTSEFPLPGQCHTQARGLLIIADDQ